MALSVKELAVHLRVCAEPGAELQEPYKAILMKLHTWATGEVASRTEAAPDYAADMGLILLAGYVFDKPASSGGARYANAWENSGAANLLRRWTKRRGVVLDDEVNADTASIGVGMGGGTFIRWSGGG